MGLAQPRVQQPQIIVDLGDGGHRAAGIMAAGALVDGDRRLQAFDQIDVGPLQLMEKLPGVDRQAFDVLPLSLGIERVEGQGAFARAAGAGDHHEAIAGDVEIDVLQVVHAGAANADALARGRFDFRGFSIHGDLRRTPEDAVGNLSLYVQCAGFSQSSASRGRGPGIREGAARGTVLFSSDENRDSPPGDLHSEVRRCVIHGIVDGWIFERRGYFMTAAETGVRLGPRGPAARRL